LEPLIERHQRAQAEDHHRDDKDPEIELQPIAEGVLRVGRLAARRMPKSSTSSFPVSTVEWIASLYMAALPVTSAAPNLPDRDRDIAGDSRDDDPERA
jgi:hypothetical protein